MPVTACRPIWLRVTAAAHSNSSRRSFAMKALPALIICTAFFAGSPVNATGYKINLLVGAGSVTGLIQTNGVDGELSASDVVDWNLLINNGARSFNLLGPLSGNNSQALVSGPGFTATPTGLFLDF